MGWFSRNKSSTCDWCGVEYDGAGVADGEMLMCSHACVEQKNAPPVQRQTVDRYATRAPTRAIAESELDVARGEAGYYEQLIQRAMHANQPDELVDLTNRAHDTYVQLWEHLDTVRAFLVDQGKPTTDYDHVRAVSLWRSDAVHSSTDVTFGGRIRITYSATFHPENVQKARHAVDVMSFALAAVG